MEETSLMEFPSRKSKRAAISHLKRPDHLSLEKWQALLRAQMGKQIVKERSLKISNIGAEAVFSTYEVLNRKTNKTYKVIIRGEDLGMNQCSCPDFSVNTLGTCKHVEAVLHQLCCKRDMRILLQRGYRPRHSSVILRYGAKRRIFFFQGSRITSALKELVRRYFDGEGYLTEKGSHRFDDWMREVKKLKEEVHNDEAVLDLIAQVRDQEVRKKRIGDLFSGKGGKDVWKQLIKAELYAYQKEGILFAAKAGRALLADDMGLGKTVQAVGVAQVMGHCLGVERVLVVCPNSLNGRQLKELQAVVERKKDEISRAWNKHFKS